jgi:hypothetical protein
LGGQTGKIPLRLLDKGLCKRIYWIMHPLIDNMTSIVKGQDKRLFRNMTPGFLSIPALYFKMIFVMNV